MSIGEEHACVHPFNILSQVEINTNFQQKKTYIINMSLHQMHVVEHTSFQHSLSSLKLTQIFNKKDLYYQYVITSNGRRLGNTLSKLT